MFVVLIGLVLLYGLMLVYLRLARRYHILDVPNERSSHNSMVVRGGGIVFYIAVLLSEAHNGFHYPIFLTGLSLIVLVSFIDDLNSISSTSRFITQLTSAILLGLQLEPINLTWYIALIVLILGIGAMNAYNFMDGINGITGIYSIAVISALMFMDFFIIDFVDSELLIMLLCSLVIFGFYNFRKNAICFAGDVGSISMAYIIIFGIALLVMATEDISFVLLLSVYGVDSILTIIHRLIKKENIFSAHRSHLYQYLVNIRQIGHLKIAVIYGLIQLVINILIIYNFQFQYLPFSVIAIITLLPLCLTYIYLKFKLEKELLILDNA